MTPSIHSTGFDSNVAKVALHFAVVLDARSGRASVYVFHGCPARGDWFTAMSPIATFQPGGSDISVPAKMAYGFVDRLCGVIDAHRMFPVWMVDGFSRYSQVKFDQPQPKE